MVEEGGSIAGGLSVLVNVLQPELLRITGRCIAASETELVYRNAAQSLATL
jgi:hypothetical protein